MQMTVRSQINPKKNTGKPAASPGERNPIIQGKDSATEPIQAGSESEVSRVWATLK